MKRSTLLFALALALTFATALPARAAVIRTIEQDLALEGATGVQIKFPVGDLEAEGAGGDRIQIEVDVRCPAGGGSRCRDAARDVVLEVRRSGSWLVLEVEGFPRVRSHNLSADVRVRLPRALRFQADLGVGEVRVRGLENDVEVDVGVGDVELTLPAAKVRTVELDTGVGEADLSIGDQRFQGSGLVGKSLDWSQGRGVAHVEVDCGVGDVEVELEE